MNDERGVTLIGAVFFVMVISVAMAGLAPLMNQVVSNLHLAHERAQAHFLTQAVLSQMEAAFVTGHTLDALVGEIEENGCRQLDGSSWLQGVPWRCQVAQADLPGEETVAVTVTLVWIDSGETAASGARLFPKLASP